MIQTQITSIWNIVHMDIKTQNLLVSRNGTVKIANFSVSQVFEMESCFLKLIECSELEDILYGQYCQSINLKITCKSSGKKWRILRPIFAGNW
ncbi:uncharacterized protein [Spinacia oleracea]|uniref:Uncharacterized protein isoform X2 n=1 Tax=Spinacia oleracea TaxID=3562 RepID=A0ABM3R120_SPIOL|nr:uncharacterized protein LOC110777496 isoform X2 [Spinacia oleracea]